MKLRSILLPLLLLLSSLATLAKSPAKIYCDYAVQQCDLIEQRLPEFTTVAEVVAQRHLKGGVIGFAPANYQPLGEEMTGRAGGMVNLGFDRVWTTDRTAAQKANDVALIGWERPPGPNELAQMQDLKKQGMYVIGFGPKAMPELTEHVKLCDAFFDTGKVDDRVVMLPDGSKAGRSNHMINALQGWVFIAELVSALTRQGKMPTMWKSYFCADGLEWGNKYFRKMQFHDDYTVAPIAAGILGKAYLAQMRGIISQFKQSQLKTVDKAVSIFYRQAKAGKKTLILTYGHMPYLYIGKYEDARWAKLIDFQVPQQLPALQAEKTEGLPVLRLGYYGDKPELKEALRSQKMRLIYIGADNPREGWQVPEERELYINMGIPFGDACVPIKDYPIALFPPSGIMQIVAYESVNVEMLAKLAKK